MPEPYTEQILIGVPAGDHYVNAGLLNLLLTNSKCAGNRAFGYYVLDGAKGYDFPRNEICRQFLQDKWYDRLWFLDNDIIPPNDILDILDIDADIVTGLVPTFVGTNDKGKIEYRLNMFRWDEDGQTHKTAGPQTHDRSEPIDAGGTASMLIRRKVLEDRRMWYSPRYERYGVPMELGPNDPPPIFKMHFKPNGALLLGEDIDFCQRARNLGYTIRCHNGDIYGHLKTSNMSNFIEWEHQRGEGQSAASLPASANGGLPAGR